jgi:hypothetical protein
LPDIAVPGQHEKGLAKRRRLFLLATVIGVLVLTGCVGAVYTVAAEHGTAGVSDASATDKVPNSIANIDQAMEMDYGPGSLPSISYDAHSGTWSADENWLAGVSPAASVDEPYKAVKSFEIGVATELDDWKHDGWVCASASGNFMGLTVGLDQCSHVEGHGDQFYTTTCNEMSASGPGVGVGLALTYFKSKKSIAGQSVAIGIEIGPSVPPASAVSGSVGVVLGLPGLPDKCKLALETGQGAANVLLNGGFGTGDCTNIMDYAIGVGISAGLDLDTRRLHGDEEQKFTSAKGIVERRLRGLGATVSFTVASCDTKIFAEGVNAHQVFNAIKDGVSYTSAITGVQSGHMGDSTDWKPSAKGLYTGH